MASEPSSSSSAGSFDDDRLPLHTIGHATRHTLPPRTLLGRVVYSAAAADAPAAAAVAAAPPPPVLRFFSVRADVASSTVVPFLASFLFLVHRRHLPPFPFLHSFLTPLPSPFSSPSPSGSFSFPFLHLEAPSPFFNEIEIAMESAARVSSLSSFASLLLPLPFFLHFVFLPLCSRCFADRRGRLAERDKGSSTANAVC